VPQEGRFPGDAGAPGDHLSEVVAEGEARDRPLPGHAERELEAYLRCGAEGDEEAERLAGALGLPASRVRRLAALVPQPRANLVVYRLPVAVATYRAERGGRAPRPPRSPDRGVAARGRMGVHAPPGDRGITRLTGRAGRSG
jgi:hypothetical protein